MEVMKLNNLTVEDWIIEILLSREGLQVTHYSIIYYSRQDVQATYFIFSGKVHKRVLVDSPLPPEPLLRLPEVTAAPDSPTFFIVGLVALCILVLLLCLLIAFMTYRLITQRKKEQAYRSKRFRSPIFRPVVETMVSAKISNNNQKTHPTALTIETEGGYSFFYYNS